MQSNSADLYIPRAIHIKVDKRLSAVAKRRLKVLYSTHSKVYPGGIKMRLVPPLSRVANIETQSKVLHLRNRQLEFTRNLLHMETWEVQSLNQRDKDTNKSVKECIMNIRSTVNPNINVFHFVDNTWKKDSVTFYFVPQVEAEARMYAAGLLPYLKAKYGD